MDRNRLYGMTDDDRSNSATALFAPRKEGNVMRKVVHQPGSLEIIENGGGKAEKTRSPSESSFRSVSRSSIGSVPPRSDSSLSRRSMTTPTKQITLQAVKRKEESVDPFVDDVEVDLNSLAFGSRPQRNKQWSLDDDFRPLSEISFVEEENVESGTADDDGHSSNAVKSATQPEATLSTTHSKMATGPSSKSGVAAKAPASEIQKKDKKEESSSDSDDDDDDDKETRKRRAPNELLMEFVDCLIKEDYLNADKLCKMILLYEPENPEALKFQPLIQEKMKLDAEAEAAEEEGDSDDDDSEDDDSDDDSDDDTSTDDSSEEDDDDNDGGKTEDINVPSTSTKDSTSKDIKGTNSIRVWKPGS